MQDSRKPGPGRRRRYEAVVCPVVRLLMGARATAAPVQPAQPAEQDVAGHTEDTADSNCEQPGHGHRGAEK